eukprot:TRINITY_DN346_c3_g1_i1.p1 TRINITY_DN346_c3_g1~~TRINITY_DN346_c3_g1_i1.p1  ORF type:complete len:264 (-),score=57.04 TRINITY_DN346_c3_g1_i1:167-958(-)
MAKMQALLLFAFLLCLWTPSQSHPVQNADETALEDMDSSDSAKDELNDDINLEDVNDDADEREDDEGDEDDKDDGDDEGDEDDEDEDDEDEVTDREAEWEELKRGHRQRGKLRGDSVTLRQGHGQRGPNDEYPYGVVDALDEPDRAKFHYKIYRARSKLRKWIYAGGQKFFTDAHDAFDIFGVAHTSTTTTPFKIKVWDYPACLPHCLRLGTFENQTFPMRQIKGTLYKVRGKCWHARDNCWGCLPNPQNYPMHFRAMSCNLR